MLHEKTQSSGLGTVDCNYACSRLIQNRQGVPGYS